MEVYLPPASNNSMSKEPIWQYNSFEENQAAVKHFFTISIDTSR
jgi:hypothetical protein